MKEIEAKTKWCPQVRHTMDKEGNFHTTNGREADGFQCCIASDCMMWVELNNEQGDCSLKRK